MCSIRLLCRPRFKCKDVLLSKDASTRFGFNKLPKSNCESAQLFCENYNICVFTKEANLEKHWLKT